MKTYIIWMSGIVLSLSLALSSCDNDKIGTQVTQPTPTSVPTESCPDIFQKGFENPFRFQLFAADVELSCGYGNPCTMTGTFIEKTPFQGSADKTAFVFSIYGMTERLSVVIPTSFIERIHLTPNGPYHLTAQIIPNWPNTYGLVITEENEIVFLGISDWRFDASIPLDCFSPIHVEQSGVLPPCEQAEDSCFGSFTRSEIQFSIGEEVKTLRQDQSATLAGFEINLDYARILSHAFCPDAGTINISYTISKQNHGLLTTLGLATPATAHTEPVNFADANLELYLRRLLHKDTGALLASELDTLRCLIRLYEVGLNQQQESPLAEITDLHGLEVASNLVEIHLSGNRINDLTPIADLTQLHSLRIDHNELGTLDPLMNLTALTRLWASNNHIYNLAPLGSLSNLTFLDLGDNSIDDITPLSSLTDLTDLSLYKNEIQDIAPLSQLVHLNRLRLDLNQIQDISTLSEMKELTDLSIDDNQVENIKPLSSLTSLTSLSLTQNNIRDISALAELTNLIVLYLGNNQIENIHALENLVNIRLLDLQDNRIRDISPLLNNQGLGEGDRVDFRGNPLNDKSINQIIPALEANGLMVSW